MKIHLDLDAFFISAERIRNPKLRGIPAAVGGRGDPFIFDRESHSKLDTIQSDGGAFVPNIFYNAQNGFEDYFVENGRIRGIIITASYEARAYGIKTGMTVREALQLYPKLVVVPPNHLYYHQLSGSLKHFLERHIPKVEQYSIDEFFGDISGWVKPEKAESFLKGLQTMIEKEFSLPISIGAAHSKWTAKLATSFAKPHGIKIVTDVEDFIKDIPIEEFPGIGRGYLRRLRAYNVHTLGETKHLKDLFYSWKKPGIQLYRRIWGIDNEPVATSSPKKSMGISRTIDPISDREEIKRRFIILARHLAYSMAKVKFSPTHIYLSLVYENGIRSKAHTPISRPFSEQLLKEMALYLFEKADIYPYSSIQRLALRCSQSHRHICYNLLQYQRDKKNSRLSLANHYLRTKYGIGTIRYAKELF